MTQTVAATLIGGPEKREIRIEPYDPTWAEKFEIHRRLITEALGERALKIEHIGSTAVPDLGAKPIVDIVVIVNDAADESDYLSALLSIGYELRVREPDWFEHRMFRTVERDVHVHVYSLGCEEVERLLALRARLRESRDDRLLYEQVKRELAAAEWDDMNDYARAKTEVIATILARAEAV